LRHRAKIQPIARQIAVFSVTFQQALAFQVAADAVRQGVG
jgi:hypothetical protein